MSIMKYLPSPKGPKKPVQVKIAEDFHEEVSEALSVDGLTWTSVIEAGLKMYMDERGRKSRRKEGA